MPRPLTTALIAFVTAVGLAGCVTTTTDQGVRPADEQNSSSDVRIDGATWSASFPGEVTQQQQPFPVDGIGELTADLTVWETDSEALLVQVVALPDSDGDAAANLLQTGASLGTPVEGSPLLDSNGTFRGLPAVVVEAQQEGALLELLAFVDGATLYQLIHVKSDPSTPERLSALSTSFELR